jgi:hypothetical protein
LSTSANERLAEATLDSFLSFLTYNNRGFTGFLKPLLFDMAATPRHPLRGDVFAGKNRRKPLTRSSMVLRNRIDELSQTLLPFWIGKD